jgi:hypothetical protein
LEKVQIDAFALKHPLSVHPVIDLISAEQKRNGWEGKQINEKVDSAADEKRGRVPPEALKQADAHRVTKYGETGEHPRSSAWSRRITVVHGLE